MKPVSAAKAHISAPRWRAASAFALALFLSGVRLVAQENVPTGTASTINVSSRLVVVDVAVLNAAGEPVTTGLAESDFQITEDGKPQRIETFEAPIVGAGDAARKQLTRTIFVLDLLNSSFEDLAFSRDQLERHLTRQPPILDGPCELMVLGNQHLQLVQGYTTDREELLSALRNIPAAYPSKSSDTFVGERFMQSISALREMGIQGEGAAGRADIVWLGHGAPSIAASDVLGKSIYWMSNYMRDTANLLVGNRASLFLVWPGVDPGGFVAARMFANGANAKQAKHDDFFGQLNFSTFVRESGGRFFFGSNDVAAQIAQARDVGSLRYTLTYRPKQSSAKAGFRAIHVELAGGKYLAVYKAGYFLHVPTGAEPPAQTATRDLDAAMRSSVPFDGLKLALGKVVRHLDSKTAEFTVNVSLSGLTFRRDTEGAVTAVLHMLSAAFTDSTTIVSSRRDRIIAQSPTDNPELRNRYVTPVVVTLRTPPKVQKVRIVMQAGEGGRLGSIEIDPKRIAEAADVATPPAVLLRRKE